MERYSRLKTIGEGAYGKALLVRCKKTHVKYVIKSVDQRKMSTKEKEEAEKECSVLREMRHPNIISFKESFTANKHLYIVMDFADGGDLYARIQRQHGRLLPEGQIMDWFVQLCLALKHVHDRKILHRDLKSQNVFLTSNGIVKLGDFGIAKVLRNTKEFARTQIGTPYYLSPEICNGQRYNNKSDIWSLGILLYEMCALKQPFSGRSLQQLVMAISRAKVPPIPRKFSDDLAALVKRLLNPAAERRPSVNKVLEIPIVRNRISNFLNGTLLQDEFSHTVLHSNPARNRPGMQIGDGGRKSAGPSRSNSGGGAAPSASAAPDAHPALRGGGGGAAAAPAQVKGVCGICGQNVTAIDERTKDDAGVYYHIACIKAEPNPEKFLAKGGKPAAKPASRPTTAAAAAPSAPTAPAAPAAPADKVSVTESAYEQKVAARHADFIARRKARLANKARAAGGKARSPIVAEEPPSAPTAAADRPARQASRGEPSQGPSREDQIREFKERQRQAAAYRARLEDERGGGGVHAEPACEAAESAGSAVAKASAARDAREAEEARKKKAAVEEYNERARRAKENRLRAEQVERGGGVPTSTSPDDRPVHAAPPPRPPAPAAAAVRRSAGRKKWDKARPPEVSVAKAILDSTYNVRGFSKLPPIDDGGGDDPKKADAKAAALERRKELRAMIARSRSELAKQGGVRNDLLPGDGASPSSDDGLPDGDGAAGLLAMENHEDILGKSISRMLDDQVLIHAAPAEAATAAAAAAASSPIAEEDAPAAETKGADEEDDVDDVAAREDADYEGMLMHMSLLAKPHSEPNVPHGAEEGSHHHDDDDDTWGDEGADAEKSESIFAKMERVRAELERDLGFDKFLESYKILRELYQRAEDVSVVEVPAEVRANIIGIMGGEAGEDSYASLLALIRAENGLH